MATVSIDSDLLQALLDAAVFKLRADTPADDSDMIQLCMAISAAKSVIPIDEVTVVTVPTTTITAAPQVTPPDPALVAPTQAPAPPSAPAPIAPPAQPVSPDPAQAPAPVTPAPTPAAA